MRNTVLAVIAIITVLSMIGGTVGIGISNQYVHAAGCNVFGSFEKITGSCSKDEGNNAKGPFNLHFRD